MALPMPGTPAFSWRMLCARIQSKFEGADASVCAAFWLFGTSIPQIKIRYTAKSKPKPTPYSPPHMFTGLINNILYEIILTAALDLVGPSIPKGTVLLASIIPGLATKLIVPYCIHLLPYSPRILLFATLSTSGMLAVALSPPTTSAQSIAAKIVVAVNRLSSAAHRNRNW